MVIGRNEGERLRRCLAGLGEDLASTVYVDSGSSDGSVSLARALGVEVVALDGQRPFTAARARNAGLARLRELVPDLELVQFLDGDCVMAEDWLVRARSAMAADASLAVVCGRRRERFPDATVYNLLCDIEWNAPPGLAQACGGDALMRIGALVEAGGYDESMIAGEEPELCLRLRQRGHRILRIAADMTLHDAHITHFAQWWKRTVRSGHAYAEGFAMHRHDPGGFWAREVRSNFAGACSCRFACSRCRSRGYGWLRWRWPPTRCWPCGCSCRPAPRSVLARGAAMGELCRARKIAVGAGSVSILLASLVRPAQPAHRVQGRCLKAPRRRRLMVPVAPARPRPAPRPGA